MGSRKLVRDLFLSKQPAFRHLLSSQLGTNVKFRLIQPIVNPTTRQLSVLNEFSRQVNGEATCNKEFQQAVKEWEGVTEDLKARTKKTTAQILKQFDGVWSESEATAKKVSANIKETICAAKEEVQQTFSDGKQEFSSSSGTSFGSGADRKSESNKASAEGNQQAGPSDTAGTLFGMLKSGFFTASPKVSMAFQQLKDTKVTDFVKTGYEIVKDELIGKPKRRQPLKYPIHPSTGETSDRTEIVVVPLKQSRWSKLWEEFKEKTRGHPVFKRVGNISKPVVEKGQELIEDLQDRWETSDNPMVHKIQDLNDKVFGENDSALSFKEIRSRDPAFSLLDFVAEVQETIRPVLNAYMKGDDKILRKYCSHEVIERRVAEHKAFEKQGVFFDNKILHISDVFVRETKMMGTTPIIILAFQTQEVYCVRDREGYITEGSKDTIHTVHYLWAMQQMDPEDVGEDAIYAMWRLRDVFKMGVQALI